MNRKALGLAVASVFAGLALPVLAGAAESAADIAKRCSQVIGERERLACYDRGFSAGPETAELARQQAAAAPAAAATTAVTPAAAAVVPAAAASTAVVPAAAAASTVAPAAASAAPAAAATSSASFGDDHLKASQKPKPESQVPTTMTASIIDIKEIRQDTWRMALDNGQIWQQMDMSSTFNPRKGDKLRIERGKLGGYMAALGEQGKSSRWIRVTRVE